MKVYFHASLGQKDKYGKYYLRINKGLEQLGYKVDAVHALEHDLLEIKKRDSGPEINEDYLSLMSRLKWADLVVCEVSYPSSAVVGHVLTRALEMAKPVLGMYHASTTGALLLGLELERFRLVEYDDYNLEKVLEAEIRELTGMPDKRFTMLLDDKLVNHLDGVADGGKSRSEYIRELIREDMKKGDV